MNSTENEPWGINPLADCSASIDVCNRLYFGHQDTRRTESGIQEDDGSVDSLATTESTSNRNKRVDIATLSDEAKMNIACDELAGEATAWAIEHPGELPPPDELMQMPYEGSKAVLRIGQTWITANEKRHLKAARQEPIIKKYIKKRHKWNDTQYASVHWDKIGQVRRRMSTSQQQFTCKLMHGLLPVGHVRKHVTHIAQCPGCTCPDETIAHVFKCPNVRMKRKRAEIIEALRKKGLRKLSRQVITTLCELVQQYPDGNKFQFTTKHPKILAAIKAQSNLGWEYFFRGYLVKDWIQALDATKNTDPHQQFSTLLQFVWFDIAQPQWQERNNVAHEPNSYLERIESERLKHQLIWYNQHRHEILPIYQQPLAEHSVEEISRMQPATRRAWINILEMAVSELRDRPSREEIRQQNEENRQRTITDFVDVQPQVQSRPRRRNIAREAREQANRVILYREQMQPRIDSIFKPVEQSTP